MRRIVWVVCTLALLAGCATIQNRNALRGQTLDHYAAALRWGGIESAWRYVDPVVRAAHPLTPQQKALYATVQVAGYEAADPTVTSPDSVERAATISLVVNTSQRAYSVHAHEVWHWDAQAKKWWLESGFPNIK
ncbi:MAG: hypothetical protein ACREPF_07880 [Rhodanobacteraceae bacterium]